MKNKTVAVKKITGLVLPVFLSLVLTQCIGSPSGLPPLVIDGEAMLSRALHVEGNKIFNDLGEEVRLTGVNIPSMEWSHIGENVIASVLEVYSNWNCNIVRLPMSQDRWFGKITTQRDDGASYRYIVDEIVRIAGNFGKYVELDLHWSNAGEWSRNIGQRRMPDMYSLEFWLDVAERYKNHPAVLFNLYNEPVNVDWEMWKYGGTITETVNPGRASARSVTYESPGHQRLVDEIRNIGANNIIIASGLGYGYDLRGIAKDYSPKSYALVDTPEGNGIAYESHIYPDKMDYLRSVYPLTYEVPVIIGEIGIAWEGPYGAERRPIWLPQMLDWIDENNFHWIAWSFHTGAQPTMLEDWEFTPTPYFGAIVKERLLSYPDTNAHLRRSR